MKDNAAAPSTFRGIKRFVVLMLENRSFDHLFGYLRATNSKVAGLTGKEFNQKDPNGVGDPEGVSPGLANSNLFALLGRCTPMRAFL
jgi:phospholipase C